MDVTILTAFEGYPDGSEASRRLFRAGEACFGLPDDFAGMIVAKRLAEAIPAAKPSRAAPVSEAPAATEPSADPATEHDA